MKNLELIAERENETREIAKLPYRSLATERVVAMELDGTWPEGFDAVLIDRDTGERWMLVDGWEAY